MPSLCCRQCAAAAFAVHDWCVSSRLETLQAQNYTCAQMRAYYRRMSVDAALKAAVFLEVEVDGAEVGAGRPC